MTLTFATNLVHHHQLPLADEFYRILGDDYHFIATQPLPDWLIKGGYDPNLDRPYIVRAYKSEDELSRARKLIDESDVVIHGAAPPEWSINRQQLNKVTFFYSERWIKRLNFHSFSPNRLKSIYSNYYRFRDNRSYMLCASAYTAKDAHFFGCFPNKCFKWGYFTAVEQNVINTACEIGESDIIKIMWCARFLPLKHPEVPVKLAQRLKMKGYKFSIDMFGSGEEYEKTKNLIQQLNLEDCVRLCGNKPNKEILEQMRHHALFLFTSNRREGWGAVINEAMSSGCVPIMSDVIGSGPYLIKEGENGFRYKYGSMKSLESIVCHLLDNPGLIKELSLNSMRTMRDLWSPRTAASRFLSLAQCATEGTLDTYAVYDGPASWDK